MRQTAFSSRSCAARPEKSLHCRKGLAADVMFDAFGIDPCGFVGNPDGEQELLDDLMPPPAALGELTAGLGEKHGAIGLLGDEPLILEPPQRLDHCRGRYPEPLRDIGTASLAPLLDEIGDQFDIILG